MKLLILIYLKLIDHAFLVRIFWGGVTLAQMNFGLVLNIIVTTCTEAKFKNWFSFYLVNNKKKNSGGMQHT